MGAKNRTKQPFPSPFGTAREVSSFHIRPRLTWLASGMLNWANGMRIAYHLSLGMFAAKLEVFTRLQHFPPNHQCK